MAVVAWTGTRRPTSLPLFLILIKEAAMKVELFEYPTLDHDGIPEDKGVWYEITEIFQDSTHHIVLRNRFGGDHTLYDMNRLQGLHITKE
jgi:hypothetical protein